MTNVATLVERVFLSMREQFEPLADRYPELRASHYRLLHLIPESGARITDLAGGARMTKQALGQFVTYLAAGGYVEVEADTVDRRVRLVRRTPRGTAARDDAETALADWEERARELVGTRRYATFRSTLVQLGGGW